ncbi:arabinosyltransferase XEG113 [Rhododendron vialii]|uniref:arabinosyltransferase XEG113 n=1 Tax=Rhododendron vialii TaxID=182163 RepID=UPI00265E4B51|nr:arabinosyltransferase XEG113 [Rhododendron vialii]
MGWKSRLQEIANSKPLFLTIYATVIIGILFSFVYVFSAVYSGNSSSAPSSWWLPQSSSDSPSAAQQPTVGEALPPAQQAQSKWMKPIWEVPPSGSKMPPLKTFQLTKELVQQRVRDNVVVVTFGNYAFMDFILTWVKHLTDIGVDNLLVGAMDTKLLEALYWKGIPVFDMGSHMSTIDVGWGSPTFHKMGREKVMLIDSVLPFGYELLMCDTDMVWLKNPLPYLSRFPEADVLTSTDSVVPTVADDRLDVWQQVGAAFNIGIFHWRPTDSAKKLAKEWKELLLADDKIWDQNGFNELVHRQLGPSVDDDTGLVYAYDGSLKLGLLPASLFCSGHTYFVQAMYQQLRLEPYAVHTTFQFAGTEGKRHRLREGMVFYDPPEYYDSPGGFLTFKPSIPKSLLLDGEHNVASHFSLVNYQIKQIRTALAIASLLNRILVMPPLWCRLDRLWFGHPGVLAGSMTRQPFLCPLDHVFEVNVMLKELPKGEFGPGINIREYSFLDNPAVPRQVKESWLDVQLCQAGSQNCQVSNSTSRPGVLKLPKLSNEETLKTAFSSFKDVKVIQFSSMQDAFLGFTDKKREEKFRNRMKRYVGIWCCVENHTPGHIYYDMYWDEKPDWKPTPPQTREDDHPPW